MTPEPAATSPRRPVVPAGVQPGAWGVTLSGGGVRAALCSIGALFALRRIDPRLEIDSIVSTSGGSIVNTALIVNAPSVDQPGLPWLDDELRRQLDALRLSFRPSRARPLLPLSLGLLGCIGLIFYASFAEPGTLLSRYPLDLTGKIVLGVILLWFVALVMARVIVVPVLVLFGAIFLGAYDASPAYEGFIAAGATAAVAITLFGLGRWRFCALRPKAAPGRPNRPANRWNRIAWAGFAIVTALLVIGGYHEGGRSFGDEADRAIEFVEEPLRLAVLAVFAWGVWQWIVLPTFVRAYFGAVIGDPERRLRWSTVTSRPYAQRRRHSLYTTELRDEVPASFSVTTGLRPARLRVRAVDDVGYDVVLDASKMKVVNSLAASASFVPVLSPVIPLQTRRLRGQPRYSVPYWHVLADGGIHGTLLSQSLGADDVPTHNRIVLDATRRRARSKIWFVLLVPKVGGQYVNYRVAQTILSSLVDAERVHFDRDVVHYRANATGANFSDGCTCDRHPDRMKRRKAEEFRQVLMHLRRSTDRFTHWWPTRRVASRCVASGAAAVIFSIKGPIEGHALLADVMTQMEEELGLRYGKKINRIRPRRPTSRTTPEQ